MHCTWRRWGNAYKILVGNTVVGDVGIDWRIILKWSLKTGCEDVDWI
jgi:hypothetical protein